MDKVSKSTVLVSIVLLAVALFLSVLWGDFGGDEVVQEPVPSPTEVYIEPDVLTVSCETEYIAVGHSVALTVTGTQSPLSYESLDPAVVQVSQTGEIMGVAPGKSTIVVTAENAVPTGYDITVIKSGLVFLSPSRQYGNPYSAGDTDEGTQMHRVAESCEKKLLAAGLEVYICPDEYELEDRGEHAASMNSLCYVAIHSNAAANQEGTSAYYHNRMPESMALALAVFDTVAALTPTSDDLGLVNGMAKDNGFGYKEVRFPGIAGVPSTLLEVEFHDKEPLAQWIIDNAEPLGIAVADGILVYLERLR